MQKFEKILPLLDFVVLGLMILSLPSLEAPKNIFLVGYLLTRIITEIIEFKKGHRRWGGWDTLFLIIVLTAFLSTLFAGFSGLEEWQGYRVFLTAILTGWLLSRARYAKDRYLTLFKLIVLSTIPPLIWGLWEYLVTHSRKTLEIHSVGHVNHSAIYLVIIFGASLAWFLSLLNNNGKTVAPKLQSILVGLMTFVFLFH